MNTEGQGHSLTLIQDNSDSTFSYFLSLKSARPIEATFHVEPPWDRIMKVRTNGICHMTKMATVSIYSTNLKNLLLWNQKADDIETWYAALVTRALPNSFK